MHTHIYIGLKVMIPSGSPQTSQMLVSKHHCTERKNNQFRCWGKGNARRAENILCQETRKCSKNKDDRNMWEKASAATCRRFLWPDLHKRVKMHNDSNRLGDAAFKRTHEAISNEGRKKGMFRAECVLSRWGDSQQIPSSGFPESLALS